MEGLMLYAATGDPEESTVGDIFESIETNLWQAEGYFLQGASGLAVECLRSAWSEYVRFRDILRVYDSTSGPALGERLIQALVARAGDSAGSLALVDGPVSESLLAA